MHLEPKEILALKEFILKKFNIMTLHALLLERTHIDLYNYILPLANFKTSIVGTIRDLSFRNKDLASFLFALQTVDDCPPIVNRLIFKGGFSFHGYQSDPNKPVRSISALQNLLNADPFIDPGIFIEKLARIKRCVCRVEVFKDDGSMEAGTGFLVSQNQVLTNYHVIQKVVSNEILLKRIKFRFDFEKSLDNDDIMISGTEVGVDQIKPIEISSPQSSLDNSGESDITVEYPAGQCDYAILNLEKEVGNLPFGINADKVGPTNTKRLWINLVKPNKDEVKELGSIFILQHPDSQPQKLAIGFNKVIGVSNMRRRFRYDVNTMHGSSGSPIFNTEFELMGVHNMGDPRYIAEFNQGVVLQAILDDLDRQNFNIQICQS